MEHSLNFIKIKEKLNLNIDHNISLNQHSILSINKVTGFSINFPIGSTCKPSKVCIKTCYALTGPVSWTAAIRKQMLNEYLCKLEPKLFAQKLATELKPKMDDKDIFLRWNGVGDLFNEAIDSISYLTEIYPNLPIWVVTRIPEYAHKLAALNLSNVYIHFSLDAKSMDRKNKIDQLISKKSNLFFSYQCDKNEIYKKIKGISVVFADKYKKEFVPLGDESICPLNTNESIEGVCKKCRRCFDGSAVLYKNIN